MPLDVESILTQMPAADTGAIPDFQLPPAAMIADEYETESAFEDELAGQSKMELRELTVQRLNELYTAYKDWRDREVFPIWDAVYRAYMGHKPQNPFPYRQVYVIREIFRQIETLNPQIFSQFFGGQQFFRYSAKHEGFDDQAAAATAIVHNQIRRQRIDKELWQWADTAVKFGTSYITYGWRKFKHVTRKVSRMHTPEGKTWWEHKSDEVVQETPYLEFLKPWEVYTHPFVEDPRNSPAVFVRKLVSTSDLKTLIREGWLDVDETRQAVDDNEGGSPETMREIRLQNAPAYDNRLDLMADGSSPHELRICWTNDGMEYAILDSKHLLRGRKCHYDEIPILTQRNYPQIGEHYGIPEPLIILDEQKLLNDFASMYVDTVHLSCNPMFKVSTAAKEKWRMASFRPGGAVYLDQMDQVEPLVVAPLQRDLQNEMGFVKRNMTLATGLTDELAGSGSSQRTATGLVRLQDAAGERMRQKVRLMMPGFEDAYKRLFELNAAYLEDEYALRMEGEDGRAVFGRYGPDVFSGEIDVDIELSNMMESSPESRQKWIEAIKLFGMDPMVNQQLLRERMFRAFGEKKPKMFLANPVSAQTDALEENAQAQAYGTLGDPNPADDHKAHAQVHQLFMQTPAFATLEPAWQEALQKHQALHIGYLEKQMLAAGMSQGAPSAPPQPGSPLPEADMRTEAIFDNGAQGGEQSAPFNSPVVPGVA